MESNKPGKRYSLLFKSFLLIGILWTIFVASLLMWTIKSGNDKVDAITLVQARSFFKQIVLTRYWNSLHGGAYVPVTEETQPNPYLKIPHRDIITENGQKMTLINPAYMTRQIAELAQNRDQVQFHITSLKPIRPDNAPYNWEAKALKNIKIGSEEYYDWWLPVEKGKSAFRYMGPLWVEKPCLTCHSDQGYVEGDLRGGISVTIPAKDILSEKNYYNRRLFFIYLLIWIIGISGIFIFYYISRGEYVERSLLIEDLKIALDHVKTLKGFIPICASCKKIRNDEGYWDKIEQYIEDHSDAEFSHSICPDCAKELYPELVDDA